MWVFHLSQTVLFSHGLSCSWGLASSFHLCSFSAISTTAATGAALHMHLLLHWCNVVFSSQPLFLWISMHVHLMWNFDLLCLFFCCIKYGTELYVSSICALYYTLDHRHRQALFFSLYCFLHYIFHRGSALFITLIFTLILQVSKVAYFLQTCSVIQFIRTLFNEH